jgi:hypothetical protein
VAAMSDEHKAALAKGRAQSRAVKQYLQALETERKRGPKMTSEKLQTRIDETRQQIETESDPVRRLELIQQRIDDEDRLAGMGDDVDVATLEKDFVTAAREYSERKGISYTAWRELGVPAAVLRDAGIARTRRTA